MDKKRTSNPEKDQCLVDKVDFVWLVRMCLSFQKIKFLQTCCCQLCTVDNPSTEFKQYDELTDLRGMNKNLHIWRATKLEGLEQYFRMLGTFCQGSVTPRDWNVVPYEQLNTIKKKKDIAMVILNHIMSMVRNVEKTRQRFSTKIMKLCT